MKKFAALLLTLVLFASTALAQAYTPAPIREDVTLADFSGQWQAVMAELSGMLLSPSETGMLIRLNIQSGWVTVTEGEGEGAYTTRGAADLAGSTLHMTYQQDAATLTRSLCLHEDGLLSMTDETGTVLYFERILR